MTVVDNLLKYEHDHVQAITCGQNCPGRFSDRDQGTHVFVPPERMFTCTHPEQARNCVTETPTGTETHAHLCDDCQSVG